MQGTAQIVYDNHNGFLVLSVKPASLFYLVQPHQQLRYLCWGNSDLDNGFELISIEISVRCLHAVKQVEKFPAQPDMRYVVGGRLLSKFTGSEKIKGIFSAFG